MSSYLLKCRVFMLILFWYGFSVLFALLDRANDLHAHFKIMKECYSSLLSSKLQCCSVTIGTIDKSISTLGQSWYSRFVLVL